LIIGERLYVDIGSVKGTSFGGSKFWVLIIDNFSSYCWSFFFKKKDKLKDKIVKLIKELKRENIQVNFLGLDDARENHALEKECKQQNLTIEFK
jgi:glycosylphosphatidylinositol transamidase (GPIT) subunit GPI8